MRKIYATYCFVVLFALLLILVPQGGASGPEPQNPEPTPGGKRPMKQEVEVLTGEFRRLRAIRGHFQGGAWNRDVDSWNGRKHQVMAALGTHFSKKGNAAAQVVQSMGEPDQQVCRGEPGYADLLQKLLSKKDHTPAACYLVYYWRGPRDFLYFIVKDGVIIRSGWWYAGE